MKKPSQKSKPVRKPRGRGQPTKYDPDIHPDYAKALAIEGLTNEEIAKKIGVALSTLQDWINKYPEFSESIKEGKEPADAKVEMSLYKRALGYLYTERKVVDLSGGGTRIETTVKEVVPDVGAQCMWLKNRRPDKWRDKQDIEHSGTINWMEVITDATDQPE